MAFKMKGNPMQRNYGIGGPMKKTGDPKKASKVVETEKPEEAPQYLTPRGHMGQPGGFNAEARTQEMDKAFDERYDNLDKRAAEYKDNVKDILKGKNKKNNVKRVGRALKK